MHVVAEASSLAVGEAKLHVYISRPPIGTYDI